MKTVLFACIHNAGRSQMAAAWFNALAERVREIRADVSSRVVTISCVLRRASTSSSAGDER